jgi:hypothetical protein
MEVFKLKGNGTNILIVDTHYYKWLLSKQPKDIHSTNTKVEYLESLGFIVGKDFISTNDISTLGYIEKHYFYSEIRGN